MNLRVRDTIINLSARGVPYLLRALRVAIEYGVNISFIAHSRYCASVLREILTAPPDLCRALIGISTIPFMGECGAAGLFALAVRTRMLQRRPPPLADPERVRPQTCKN